MIFINLFLIIVCQTVIAIDNIPIFNFNGNYSDPDCEDCDSAKAMVSRTCSISTQPTQVSEMKELFQCICQLHDDFFDDLADCLKECRTFGLTRMDYDEERLRRYYCDFASRLNSITDEAGSASFDSILSTILSYTNQPGAGRTTDGQTQVGTITTNDNTMVGMGTQPTQEVDTQQTETPRTQAMKTTTETQTRDSGNSKQFAPSIISIALFILIII
ncbi:uncharacterized protein KGF55_005099 [Candida pseudojiufengensis]|uniref:uncharacterized protein n=1 Tax=Candida pseudojiufengensis TaxID=497109 RepID=UPI00222449B4|nr:uncharacterized protein KGF55_005099 [Candida pseudojiufengensis]KAI5959867.1 hypothetical protein KGF55_005099 [Candida pseudojiufengensis]